MAEALISIKNKEKYLLVQSTSYFWALQAFQVFTGHLIQIELHLLSIVLLSGFQGSRGLWNLF